MSSHSSSPTSWLEKVIPRFKGQSSKIVGMDFLLKCTETDLEVGRRFEEEIPSTTLNSSDEEVYSEYESTETLGLSGRRN